MGRASRLPRQLLDGPFTRAEGIAAGLSPTQLERGPWHRLARGYYVWRVLMKDPEMQLGAALLRVPPTAVFSGPTAGWLHGLDVSPTTPLEVTVPKGGGVSGRAGLLIRRAYVEPDDVCELRGYPATGICRTLADLARGRSITEAVVLVDAALHLRLTTRSELRDWASRNRGGAALRRTLEHAEPLSESPMETRLRMLLVLAGLPRPQAQVTLNDASGRFLGRVDLYYPEQRLALEYDGGTHRDSLAADDLRQNRLVGAGITMLRFTAADLRDRPAAVAAEVGALLRRPSGEKRRAA